MYSSVDRTYVFENTGKATIADETFMATFWRYFMGRVGGEMRRTYSQEELVERAFLRLAVFLHGLWEEGDNADSRLFEKLIPDAFVKKGMSVRAQQRIRENVPASLHREHVVPCAVLRDCVFKRFHDNATPEEVALDIRRNLVIVDILSEEARRMDFELNLKARMPDDWRFESNDPLARLRAAGIEVANPSLEP